MKNEEQMCINVSDNILIWICLQWRYCGTTTTSTTTDRAGNIAMGLLIYLHARKIFAQKKVTCCNCLFDCVPTLSAVMRIFLVACRSYPAAGQPTRQLTFERDNESTNDSVKMFDTQIPMHVGIIKNTTHLCDFQFIQFKRSYRHRRRQLKKKTHTQEKWTHSETHKKQMNYTFDGVKYCTLKTMSFWLTVSLVACRT